MASYVNEVPFGEESAVDAMSSDLQPTNTASNQTVGNPDKSMVHVVDWILGMVFFMLLRHIYRGAKQFYEYRSGLNLLQVMAATVMLVSDICFFGMRVNANMTWSKCFMYTGTS